MEFYNKTGIGLREPAFRPPARFRKGLVNMMEKKGWGLLLTAVLLTLLTAIPAFASTENPATGDHSMIGIVAAVLVVSLAVIIALVVVSIRKKGR